MAALLIIAKKKHNFVWRTDTIRLHTSWKRRFGQSGTRIARIGVQAGEVTILCSA
jgi:hypothetical protein